MKKIKVSKIMQDLIDTKTLIVEACQKIQVTKKATKGVNKDYITEIITSPCKRISGLYCGACAYPDKKWRLGNCNLATHLYIENKKGVPQVFITPMTMEVEIVDNIKDKMINPIKLSKRQSR